MAGVAAVLSEYPPETMRWVTDPRTGIAANPLPDPDTGRVWTGMPDLANVKRACEVHYGPERRKLQRAKAERDQEEARKLLEAPRGPRPTYEQLVERCARDGLMIGPARRGGGWIDPVKAGDDFMASHGLTREQFDAIPNAVRK